MHYMAEDTPFRLSNEKMNASDGITYLAGISEDGSNISILISNYNSPDIKCILNLTNLPWNASYREIHYLIDKNHHLEIVENKTFSDSNYFSIKKIGRNTVHFVRLTNSTAIPKEGPEVAKIPFLLRLHFLDPLTRIIGIILLSLIFG
ncbi:MAG TPA: hypothetical protein ENI33_05040 [Thermoplasmatales archaeon]|nr:hypothetical protein [Thermoplasmatales archaeon]